MYMRFSETDYGVKNQKFESFRRSITKLMHYSPDYGPWPKLFLIFFLIT